MLIQRT